MIRFLSGAVIAATLVSGCIGLGQASEGTCSTSQDCDWPDGEICDEGVCWGGISDAAQFAAILVPPASRPDLAQTELLRISIADNGNIEDLLFEPSVELKGHISIHCDAAIVGLDCTNSIAAQIHISRPSRIPGAPDYTRTTTSTAGIPASSDSFSIHVPATNGDEVYEISIIPGLAEPNDQTVSPANHIAPLRTLVQVPDDRTVNWQLGDPSKHHRISGRVLTVADDGTSRFSVFARGKTAPDALFERESSVGLTLEDGTFEISIRNTIEPEIELIIVPNSAPPTPTLNVGNISLEATDATGKLPLGDILFPDFTGPKQTQVIVRSQSNDGDQLVAGAEVELSTEFPAARGVVRFVASVPTGINGTAALPLLLNDAGNPQVYQVSITPPATATQDGVLQQQINIAQTTNTIDLTLPTRSSVAGIFVNSRRLPLLDTAVSASLSPDFRKNLAPDLQAAIKAIQFAATTTDEDGRFTIWVDSVVNQQIVEYALELVPAANADAPRWMVPVGEKGTQLSKFVDLGTISLPPAGHARGGIFTATREPLQEAEVQIFQLTTSDSCEETVQGPTPDPDAICETTSSLRGVWRPDAEGIVRIVVPDLDN